MWEEGDYIPIARLPPSQWLLHSDGQRWEPFECFINYEGQRHKTVSTDHNFWRERKAEPDSNRGPSAYQPNALPLGQTGSNRVKCYVRIFIFRCTLVVVSTGWHYSYQRPTEFPRRDNDDILIREKKVQAALVDRDNELFFITSAPASHLPIVFVCVFICLALLEKAWSKHMNVKTTTTTPLFIRTKTQRANFRGNSLYQPSKTTLEEECNGENWAVELGHLSAFDWGMLFWKTTYFYWKFAHVLFCLKIFIIIYLERQQMRALSAKIPFFC